MAQLFTWQGRESRLLSEHFLPEGVALEIWEFHIHLTFERIPPSRHLLERFLKKTKRERTGYCPFDEFRSDVSWRKDGSRGEYGRCLLMFRSSCGSVNMMCGHICCGSFGCRGMEGRRGWRKERERGVLMDLSVDKRTTKYDCVFLYVRSSSVLL